MKQTVLIIIAALLLFSCTSRKKTVGQQALPTTAPVNVTVHSEKHAALEKLVIVFKSKQNKKEYKAYTDDSGKVSLVLPFGDTYQIYIDVSGIHDEAIILYIPALKSNQYYKGPFKVDIEYEASKTYILSDCLFAINSFTVSIKSYGNLNSLAEYLKNAVTQKIELGGHCGSGETNQLALCLNRAKAVKDYLISQGIQADRIVIKSYGSAEPNQKTSEGTGEPQNRRTGILLVK